VTSRTKTMSCQVGGITVTFLPAALYCYTVGYNIIHHGAKRQTVEQIEVGNEMVQPILPFPAAKRQRARKVKSAKVK
jgi:hypothetical protein